MDAGDVNAKALLYIFAFTLANTCNTLSNVKGKVLNNSLAETPPGEKTETLGEAMGDVKGKLLVDTVSENL